MAISLQPGRSIHYFVFGSGVCHFLELANRMDSVTAYFVRYDFWYRLIICEEYIGLVALYFLLSRCCCLCLRVVG